MDKREVIKLTQTQTKRWREIEQARVPRAWVLDVTRANQNIETSRYDVCEDANIVQRLEEDHADLIMEFVSDYLERDDTPALYPHNAVIKLEGRILVMEWEGQSVY